MEDKPKSHEKASAEKKDLEMGQRVIEHFQISLSYIYVFFIESDFTEHQKRK